LRWICAFSVSQGVVVRKAVSRTLAWCVACRFNGGAPNDAPEIFGRPGRLWWLVVFTGRCRKKIATAQGSKTALAARAAPRRAKTIASNVPPAFSLRRNKARRNDIDAAPPDFARFAGSVARAKTVYRVGHA